MTFSTSHIVNDSVHDTTHMCSLAHDIISWLLLPITHFSSTVYETIYHTSHVIRGDVVVKPTYKMFEASVWIYM